MSRFTKLSTREELFGGSTPSEAVKIFDSVLNGTSSKSQRQTVLVNSAFAIHVIEPQKSMEECVDMARESLDSKKALRTFEKFVEINS